MRDGMRQIRAWTPAVLYALALGACARWEALVEPVPEQALVGAWRWVESTGGIAGSRITPDAAGAVRLEFDGRTVRAYRGAESVARVGYAVHTDAPARDTDGRIVYDAPLDVFVFDPRIEEQRFGLGKGDTLVLADPCCDRYAHTFVRVVE